LLRCKSPELVRKELWMGLLGNEVIRTVMAEAAGAHGRMPHRLSFKGALQALLAHAQALREGSPMRRRRLWGILLELAANDVSGHRPDGAEPPARKRRPKPYPLLTAPRQEAKEVLLKAS
jgi:hypothetical protein